MCRVTGKWLKAGGIDALGLSLPQDYPAATASLTLMRTSVSSPALAFAGRPGGGYGSW